MPEPEMSPRPPESWQAFRSRTQGHWARHLLYVDWVFSRIAWSLGRWSLLKVLAYAESFSVLVALIFWVAEAGERVQQKHYQAWQVINTAQGKGGSGGRVDALEQLNHDRVPLTGVDVSDAFLQDVRLEKAELRRSNLRGTDLRNAHFRGASLVNADFTSANLRGADLRGADLSGAAATDADLTGANLSRAIVRGLVLDKADLRDADLSDLRDWGQIKSIGLANIFGVRNPPPGFVQWAAEHRTVQIAATEQWNAVLQAESTENK